MANSCRSPTCCVVPVTLEGILQPGSSPAPPLCPATSGSAYFPSAPRTADISHCCTRLSPGRLLCTNAGRLALPPGSCRNHESWLLSASGNPRNYSAPICKTAPRRAARFSHRDASSAAGPALNLSSVLSAGRRPLCASVCSPHAVFRKTIHMVASGVRTVCLRSLSCACLLCFLACHTLSLVLPFAQIYNACYWRWYASHTASTVSRRLHPAVSATAADVLSWSVANVFSCPPPPLFGFSSGSLPMAL